VKCHAGPGTSSAALRQPPLTTAERRYARDVHTHTQAADASPDAADSQGRTALHYAAENGKSRALETLSALGASLAAADHAGVTPLHVAARAGHAAAVSTLLRLGADPQALSAKGLTPAQYVVNQAILPLLQPDLAAAGEGEAAPHGMNQVHGGPPQPLPLLSYSMLALPQNSPEFQFGLPSRPRP